MNRKPKKPKDKDLFETWALEVGLWKKIDGQITDNATYGYAEIDRIKLDFSDWQKKGNRLTL